MLHSALGGILFEKPTKPVFPHGVEGVRFLVGDVEMDVPHWYIRHLPLKFKKSSLAISGLTLEQTCHSDCNRVSPAKTGFVLWAPEMGLGGAFIDRL